LEEDLTKREKELKLVLKLLRKEHTGKSKRPEIC
jgi:hypothetical protein